MTTGSENKVVWTCGENGGRPDGQKNAEKSVSPHKKKGHTET